MDKLSDILKEIRSRFSSPLISSYVISWLVLNWRIPIGLFFYKNDQLIKDGINSYIDLIDKNKDSSKEVLYPLLCALAYTFVYPILKNCILAFNAWVKTWGTRWNLEISKKGKIAVEHYIKLRDTYKTRTKILEDVLSKESGFVQENEQLRNETLNLKNQNNNWNENYNKLLSYSNVTTYDGEWEMVFLKGGQQLTQRILIGNGNISITDVDGRLNTIFKINSIGYIASSAELILIIENKQEENNQTIFYQVLRPRTPEKRTYYSAEPGAIIQELRKL